MTRPSRMLLVLTIFAVLSVAVLGLMARRYGSIIERRAEATQAEAAQALRHVDDFIRARRALRAPEASFQDALEEGGLSRTEYLHLDRQYRDWKTGRSQPARRYAAAFELRRDDLAATESVASSAAGPQQ